MNIEKLLFKEITYGLSYYNEVLQLQDKSVKLHITKFEQGINSNLTLLLSKVSEAILPNTIGNHIGEGSTMNNFLEKQKGVRFIINGGFSHYRKNFYDWKHQNYNVGDPVGLTKIREHFFEDYIQLEHYGFFIQETKQSLWNIIKKESITTQEKYILSCTPLLIYNKEKIEIPKEIMVPIEEGKINPPSILGHGLQNNPRTAIGIKDKDIYFITIEGNEHFVGCNLLELQKIGLDLQLDSLLNLDGGGSSQFRIMTDNHNIISNEIYEEDKNRILGHVLVIFDETLK